jgi:E3 ubiquitin-protein ligase SDIR1
LLSSLPTRRMTVMDATRSDLVCAICLVDYRAGELVRTLPCFHAYHTHCIDPWLEKDASCPVCNLRLD